MSDDTHPRYSTAEAIRLHHVAQPAVTASVLRLFGLDLFVPDHPTVSRRSCGIVRPRPHTVPYGPVHLITDSTGSLNCSVSDTTLVTRPTPRASRQLPLYLMVNYTDTAVLGRLHLLISVFAAPRNPAYLPLPAAKVTTPVTPCLRRISSSQAAVIGTRAGARSLRAPAVPGLSVPGVGRGNHVVRD